MKNKTTKKDEMNAAIVRIVEEVDNDPKVATKAEEFHRKYCTLTEEDLALTFTI